MTKWEAFLRQAGSDFEVYELLQNQSKPVDLCHRLHYLQMAVEKLAKAAALRGDPNADIYTHFFYRKFWSTLRKQARVIARNLGYEGPQQVRAFLDSTQSLFYEIENLSPDVVTRRGAKGVTPNAEYPWEARGDDGFLTWYAPASHPFPELAHLHASAAGIRLPVLIRQLLKRFTRVF